MGFNNPSITYQRVHKTGRPRKAIVDGKQQCSKCLEWKDLETEFGRNSIMASGRETRCKPCNTKRGQEQRAASIENAMKHLAYCNK